MQTELLIKDFIEAQQKKMSWLEKAFMNYPKVESTVVLAQRYKPQPLPGTTAIRTAVSNKFAAIFALLFVFILWISLLRLLLLNKSLFAVYLLGLLFASFIMRLLIQKFFLSRKYNYEIVLNSEGVTILGHLYAWPAVTGTYIMSSQQGKNTRHRLILITDHKDLKNFDLQNFVLSPYKLSFYIEYYKSIAPGNT